MTVVDDFSRFAWTYFLKKKSDVPAVFAVFLAGIRAQGTPFIVECLRSDNGKEFTKGEFVTLQDHHRIRREYTPVDSPKYDGVVERRCPSLRGRDGVLPGGSPPVRRRASAADRASMGGSVRARE